MTYFLYLIFALAPSVIWLLFFLRKDKHPESNTMVLTIFLFGMLAAIPAALIEAGFFRVLLDFVRSNILFSILGAFFIVALVEEIFKYLVVRGKVLRHSEFDEPLDVMLYMIIAALGFAVTENLLILSSTAETSNFNFGEIFIIISFRFVGATFLHALCSGTLGYFWAISFCEHKNKFKIFLGGFSLIVFLHGLYNFSITNTGLIYSPLRNIIDASGNVRFLIPFLILVGLASFVSFGFKKLKKVKSVCKI